MSSTKNIAIIGGGAAGYFSAIHCKMNHPEAKVTIYEKSTKVLSKVKVSGGGRCNLTNASFQISDLIKNYPRGGKSLRKVFHQFGPKDIIDWFEQRGVPSVIQDDLCVFPKSQSSQSIIDCFINEANKLGVNVKTSYKLLNLKQENEIFHLTFDKDFTTIATHVIVTVGGQPKSSGLDFLSPFGLKLIPPVPSLFTFNMPNEAVKDLMGIVVEETEVKIQGTKLKSQGPLLVTHWGMSGPSILKLSAWGARILEEKNYEFKLQVNWLNGLNDNELNLDLSQSISVFKDKKIKNQKLVPLPSRLWDYLLHKIDLNTEKKWGDISKKEKNKLINILINDVYSVKGKTTFKEEFVTAGGVDLSEIDFNTMASKKVKGLYFSGEVIDIDGITGGFNFQAAWSTAFVASKLI